MKWAYGVTTVPDRAHDQLPNTLKSLETAGFDNPRLFIDGTDSTKDYDHLGLQMTTHFQRVQAFGNWVLALWELYIREPKADRYAIFQDDFVTYHNLKDYLESCKFPKRGYWNLYTFPQNQIRCPSDTYEGWFLSNQLGLSAIGLIFNHETIPMLLSHPHLVEKPRHVQYAHRKIDGCVVDTMKKLGMQEFVHSPSLTQHTGKVSTLGNHKQALASKFYGQDFDARELIHD